MSRSRVAIITARGGSKRIPRKNIRPFLGRPILHYPIAAALSSGLFDEVMVSTDDDEIATVATSLGAKVPFRRSAKAADDFATTADVVGEVLETYESRGRQFDDFCVLYPTAPFVTAAKLTLAAAELERSGAETLFVVARFGYPIQRALRLHDGKLTMIRPEFMNARSQDLEPAYHDSGQFYFGRTAEFLRTRKFFTENTVAIVAPESEVQDIDTEEDWKIAELKYQLMPK